MRELSEDERAVLADDVADPDAWWLNAQTAFAKGHADAERRAQEAKMAATKKMCAELNVPFDDAAATQTIANLAEMKGQEMAELALANKVGSMTPAYAARLAQPDYKNRAQRDLAEKVARDVAAAANAAAEAAALEEQAAQASVAFKASVASVLKEHGLI